MFALAGFERHEDAIAKLGPRAASGRPRESPVFEMDSIVQTVKNDANSCLATGIGSLQNTRRIKPMETEYSENQLWLAC